MNNAQNLTRIIAGALLSGCVAVAGLGPTAGSAQARPGPAPLNHYTWCPGHPDPNDHTSPGGLSPRCRGRGGI